MITAQNWKSQDWRCVTKFNGNFYQLMSCPDSSIFSPSFNQSNTSTITDTRSFKLWKKKNYTVEHFSEFPQIQFKHCMDGTCILFS